MGSLKAKQKDALRAYGVAKANDYYLGFDRKPTDGAPKIWGETYTHTASGASLFLEHEADEYGGNWRWYIRQKPGQIEKQLAFKTKRTAISTIALTLCRRYS